MEDNSYVRSNNIVLVSEAKSERADNYKEFRGQVIYQSEKNEEIKQCYAVTQ